MIHFPAPFTLCSVTSLIGAVLTAAFQVVTAGRFSPGTPQISLEIVLSLVLVVTAKRCDNLCHVNKITGPSCKRCLLLPILTTLVVLYRVGW